MSRRARGEGTISERKDGRWEARIDAGWQDGKRKRTVVYGRTQAEVSAKLRAELRATEDGRVSGGRGQTVAAFLAGWLVATEGKVRPKTLLSYEQITRGHLIPALGRLRLQKLTVDDVEAMLAGKRRSGLSPRTVSHLRAVLRTALNQACRARIITWNAAAATQAPKVARHDFTVLRPEQARQLIAAAEAEGERLRGLYTVAVALGLRQGEALGLRWQDVDLERRQLGVRFALQRIRGVASLVEPKTSRSRRTIHLPAAVVEALLEHRGRQTKERIFAGPLWQDMDLVFTSTIGTPLYGSNVTKNFQRFLTKAGLPRMRFHELRHSAASLMLAQGVPLRTVMEVLGHSTITLTANTYGHLFPQLMDDAATAMDRALGSRAVAIPVVVS